MTLAQLIAALAAQGGLRTAGAVEAAMREAAAPERDFRQLIDMVRAAISNLVNNGRLPEQRRYVSLSAIYSDRAIVEIEDGKHYQYSYAIKRVDGADQVVLSAPVEVIEQYVPTVAAPAPAPAAAAVREAMGSFQEAADGSIAVTLIRAGRSVNCNYYTDTVLREGAPLFDGVRVFAKPDAAHFQGKLGDVSTLLGGIYDVRFVEGAGPDAGSLVGTFRPLNPADPTVVKMTEAVRRGMQGLMGLSIDAIASTKTRVQDGQKLREAKKFTRVISVDLILNPSAGGSLDRLTEAAADPLSPHSKFGEPAMPLWKQRLLEAIQARDPLRYAQINPQTVGDDELVRLHEAICGLIGAAPGQRLTEAQGADAPVTRAELQMLQLRGVAAARITASALPKVAKDKLQAQFASQERFTEAQVDAAIKAEGEYLARFTESGAVRVPAFGAGSITVGDRSVLMGEMLDAFFDPAHKNHRNVRSFRECYVEITGDRRVTGRVEDVDMGRMRESLGEDFRESIGTGSFANTLGSSVTRRMQAIYTGMTNLDAWRKVAVWGPVNDFRTVERVRIGGYGNLPTVAQGDAYAALSSPSDEKATYAATKRGGTEDVTLEAITNDDVQAIRRIPLELALAAKNTLYEFVFDFYRANAAIYDTKALYHADHANLFTAGLDAAEFAKHRLAMLKQTRAGSGKRLATGPGSILVPFELQELAFNLFVRNQNLDKTFVQSINPEVIPVAYWTDANDWCTVADPMILPVVEIGFLGGKEDPELFVQDMANVGSLFANDKITYKIRHIYGGGVLVDGYKGTTKAVVA